MLWWFAETALVAAVLAALATLAGRSGRFGPEARHAFWLVVLVRLVLPPVVSWPWSIPGPWAGRPVVANPAPAPMGVAMAGPVAVSTAEGTPPSESLPGPAAGDELALPLDPPAPVGARPIEEEKSQIARISVFKDQGLKSEIRDRQSPIPRLLLAGWLAGMVAVVARRLAGIVRFRRTLAGATPAPAWLADEARAIGERLGVRPPPVLVTVGGRTPLLWCLGRPLLLVPSALVDRLAADRWPGILAHELAHLGRRDHWVARLELVAEAAWWWNPVFWHVRRRLHDEAEHACDARVVRVLPGRRFAYAEALIEVCEHLSRPAAIPAPALGVVGPGASRSLEGRLEMILRDPAPRRPGRLAALAVAALAALSIPAWTLGQPPDAPKVEAPPKPEEPPKADAWPQPEEPPKVDPSRVAEKPAEAPAAEVAPTPDDFLVADSPDGAAISGLDPEALRAVRADPKVIAAANAYQRARSDLEAVIRRSKSPTEPEEQEARKRLADLAGKYAKVWSARAKEARDRPKNQDQAGRDPIELLDVDPRTRREIRAHPEVKNAYTQYTMAAGNWDDIRRKTRAAGDPSEQLARNVLNAASVEYRAVVREIVLSRAREAREQNAARETEAAIARARRDGKAAEVQKAEAQRRLPQAMVARNETLRKKGPNFVSNEEVAKAEAELAIAEAEVAGKKAALAEADATLGRAGPDAEGGLGRSGAEGTSSPSRLASAEPHPKMPPPTAGSTTSGPLPSPSPIVRRGENDAATPRPAGAPAPELTLSLAGQPRCLAGETMTYEITLANTGAAPATGIQVSATLPPQGGRYLPDSLPADSWFDKKARKLVWLIPRLEPSHQINLSFEYKTDTAGLYICAVEATSGETRLSDRSTTSVVAGPPPAPTPSGPPTEAREAVELLEVQLQGRRAELDGVIARADLAKRRHERIKELVGRNAVEARLADEVEAEVRTAEAALGQKKAEVLEYEVRLKQARRRANEAEALLKGDLARAKDRLDWSTEMRKKGYVSESQQIADRLNYEALLRQIGPEPKPKPAEEPASPARPGGLLRP